MKEIGPKFAKIGDKSLTALVRELTITSEDLSPAVKSPQINIKDSDKISLLTLNNTKVYLYSQKLAGFNLYRILNYIKPEQIYMQIRPDDINPLNSTTLVSPQHLIPSLSSYTESLSYLKKSGFLITNTKDSSITGNINIHQDRLSSKACVISAIWAMQHNLPSLYLADIPRKLLYRMLTNSTTLMQLQSIYSHINRLIGSQPDSISIDEPDFPITLGYKLYPHIWDIHSVKYLAKEIIQGTSTYKKILCIASRETGQRLEELLTVGFPPVNYDISLYHTSIIRKDCTEIVVEKLSLIDAICFGIDLIDIIARHSALARAENFIQELVEAERVEGKCTMAMRDIENRRDFLQKLYLSKLKFYSTYGKGKLNDGKEKLQTEFLKQILKSN